MSKKHKHKNRPSTNQPSSAADVAALASDIVDEENADLAQEDAAFAPEEDVAEDTAVEAAEEEALAPTENAAYEAALSAEEAVAEENGEESAQAEVIGEEAPQEIGEEPQEEAEEAVEEASVETPEEDVEELPAEDVAEEEAEPQVEDIPTEEAVEAEENVAEEAPQAEPIAEAEPQEEAEQETQEEADAASEEAEQETEADGALEKTPEELEAEKAQAEEEERKRQEAAEKKAAAKAKRKEWVKKHVGLIVILCVAVLLAAGLATGHFVTTMKVAFIHKVEDLEKALAEGKKTEYIFKSDIIYNGDLALEGVKVDMNKHTLEVKGNLTYTGDGFIGYKKMFWGKPQVGGAVIVEGAYTQLGNVSWYSPLAAERAEVTGDLAIYDTFSAAPLSVTGSLTVAGEYVNELADVIVGGDLTVSGKVNGRVALTGDADVAGNVKSIVGGKAVKVCGAVEEIDGAEKLYLYPDSEVGSFKADTYYFVQYLEAPTVVVKKVNGTQYLLISHVLNADGYKIKVEGTDAEYDARKTTGENTAYSMPDLDPGNYKVNVMPYSDTPDVYLSGASTQIKLSYYVQLATPVVTVDEVAEEDGTHVVVNIQKVQYAANYVVHVGGKDYTVKAEDGVTTYDITSLVTGTGSYDVYVYAKPPKKGNYETSETTLVTYVRSATATVSVTAYAVEGGSIEATISGADAYYYLVEWKKGDVVVDSVAIKAIAEGNSVQTALTMADVDTVTVTPLAKGYYRTGAAYSTAVLAAKPAADTDAGDAQGE